MKTVTSRGVTDSRGVQDKDQIVKDIHRAEKDTVWFYNNQKSLRRRYLKQWVAVKDLKVVMADKDRERLVRRLKARPCGRDRAMILLVEPEGTAYAY